MRVDGIPATKPATPVTGESSITVEDEGWVSRAAHKLLGALKDLSVDVPARVLDAGSSTGGFTQVLLRHGAKRVYAVDVGTDQLAPELRSDARVVVHEQTNLRDLTLAHVEGEPVGLVVSDVSFISLTLLLEPMFGVLDERGEALLMVKPQFEVGRARLARGGVVRDPADRAYAVTRVTNAAAELGWTCLATAESTLPGPAGNVETFIHLRRTHLC